MLAILTFLLFMILGALLGLYSAFATSFGNMGMLFYSGPVAAITLIVLALFGAPWLAIIFGPALAAALTSLILWISLRSS